MSDIRIRIAKASASRNAKNAGMDPEEFWDSLHSSLQEAYLLDADAVIRELKPELEGDGWDYWQTCRLEGRR